MPLYAALGYAMLSCAALLPECDLMCQLSAQYSIPCYHLPFCKFVFFISNGPTFCSQQTVQCWLALLHICGVHWQCTVLNDLAHCWLALLMLLQLLTGMHTCRAQCCTNAVFLQQCTGTYTTLQVASTCTSLHMHYSKLSLYGHPM